MSPTAVAALLAAALRAAVAMRSEDLELMLNTDLSDRSLVEAAGNQSIPSLSDFIDMARYFNDIKELRKGYQKSFCGRTPGGICDTLQNFPGKPTMNYLSWHEAEQKLLEVEDLYKNHEIYRGNELGYFILNDGLWARDFKTIGLGATEEQHRMFRPIVDSYLGIAGEGTIWSEEIIDKHLEKYLLGKKTLHTKEGIFEWTTRLMHKLHLDLELSDADVKRFIKLQSDAIFQVVIPHCLPSCTDIQNERDYFLEKYRAAIRADTRGVFPASLVTEEDVPFMASALMDSMLFAGGMSVGNLIRAGLGVLYSDPSNIWRDRRELGAQLSEENVDQFVFELVRLFPAVIGFPWYPPKEKKKVRVIVNLATALRDVRVWGQSGDVLEFHLRPPDLYQRHVGIAWAEPANGKEAWAVRNPGRSGKLHPMSRGCPGQALSIAIMKVFFKRWVKSWTQWHVIEAPSGGVKFEDHRPYVGEVILGLVRKTGALSLVDKGILKTTKKNQWVVMTHGDAKYNAVLLVFEKGGYQHDDPESAAARIEIKRNIKAKTDKNYLESSNKLASCFIIEATGLKGLLSKSTRLCAEERGNKADNDKDALMWVTAINEAAMKARDS